MTTDVVLSVEHVTAYHGAVRALADVSIRVLRGEIVALIGANGAGKTTLMNTICGAPHARTGRVRHEGEDITDWPTHRIMNRSLAYAPEGRRIFPRMTVVENMTVAIRAGASRETSNWLLTRVFDLFPRLAERKRQLGGTLSGGEQQMLAIARALMRQPNFLLLDEPSLGLAPTITSRILSALRELNRQGLTILLVEQNARQALHLAHRGYVLVNGAVVMEAPANELLARPDIREAYLGGAKSERHKRASHPLAGF